MLILIKLKDVLSYMEDPSGSHLTLSILSFARICGSVTPLAPFLVCSQPVLNHLTGG